jgi:hypothetical protein
MIFSASRRTDIPAFYGEWMLNRLRSGEIAVRNPMNPKQVTHFKFKAASIDGIVFWTKNPAEFIKYLDEINRLGYKYYFQFTVTPYGNDIEKNLDKSRLFDTFIQLSGKTGKEKVIWRYDPVIINSKYSVAFHSEHFEEYAERLHKYTEKCVISFIDGYPFLDSSFKEFEIQELHYGQIEEIIRTICNTADRFFPKLQIASCSEKIDLAKFNVRHNKCVDDELIARITGKGTKYKKDPSQRKECCCTVSRDIGAYNTCRHACVYCYACHGAQQKKACNPDSLILCDEIDYNADSVKVIDFNAQSATGC